MLVVTLRQLRRSHTAMVGLVIVVLLLLVAALADVLALAPGNHLRSMAEPHGAIQWGQTSWDVMSSAASFMVAVYRSMSGW